MKNWEQVQKKKNIQQKFLRILYEGKINNKVEKKFGVF